VKRTETGIRLVTISRVDQFVSEKFARSHAVSRIVWCQSRRMGYRKGERSAAERTRQSRNRSGRRQATGQKGFNLPIFPIKGFCLRTVQVGLEIGSMGDPCRGFNGGNTPATCARPVFVGLTPLAWSWHQRCYAEWGGARPAAWPLRIDLRNIPVADTMISRVNHVGAEDAPGRLFRSHQ